jgi:chromosome segregation ATPase
MSDSETLETGIQGPGESAVPKTFGQKLSFMAPQLVCTALVSVGLSYLLFRATSGSLVHRVQQQEQSLRAKDKEFRKRITVTENASSQLMKSRDEVEKQIAVLVEEKETLKKALTVTVDRLGSAQKGLEQINENLTKCVKSDAQESTDAQQNARIAENSTRLTYVERRLKALESIKDDVMSLKNDTGNLKGQYAELKRDLSQVQEKGEVTQKELDVLTERARLFQLRVLAARAREAAEAARQGDLKKLLARLSEEE